MKKYLGFVAVFLASSLSLARGTPLPRPGSVSCAIESEGRTFDAGYNSLNQPAYTVGDVEDLTIACNSVTFESSTSDLTTACISKLAGKGITARTVDATKVLYRQSDLVHNYGSKKVVELKIGGTTLLKVTHASVIDACR